MSTKLFKRFLGLVSVAIESSLTTYADCSCKVVEGGHKGMINGKEMAFAASILRNPTSRANREWKINLYLNYSG